MSYKVEFTVKAKQQLENWHRSGKTKILKKIAVFLDELREHPTTGTGHVEQLKGDYAGYWSRRLDKESRLVYRIEEDNIVVVVVSLMGHYGDK
ncbi:MAG: Txe/YoeB family addiction module toxin [Muribaculaceae bacterium]|nr:Txe/YoeB family addiction module toxin [Muribaculaceae bacterium]